MKERSLPGGAYFEKKGTRVCPRWHDFRNFLADMGECPSGLSLDRIDNDGDYEPGNCRWATSAVQTRNTCRNRWLEHDGRRMVLVDWAAHLGISYQSLQKRLRKWPIERALGAVKKT